MYDDKDFVEQYCEMMKDFDNSYVISQFKSNIGTSLKVLELGMGAGIDYLSLKNDYNITTSDNSQAFIDRFTEDVLKLDALTIETDETFDCIYSNKVMNVFTFNDIIKSINRQYEILNSNGYIFMTVWKDDPSSGDKYIFTENKILEMLNDKFELVKLISYTEIEEEDSYIIIAQKKDVSN